jgi:hypothetical protein
MYLWIRDAVKHGEKDGEQEWEKISFLGKACLFVGRIYTGGLDSMRRTDAAQTNFGSSGRARDSLSRVGFRSVSDCFLALSAFHTSL